MNNTTRKAISALQSELSAVRSAIEELKDHHDGATKPSEASDQLKSWADRIDDIGSQAETIGEEEQEKFDNMPEGLQSSERGEKLEAAVSAAEDAKQAADDAVNALTPDAAEDSAEDLETMLETALDEIENLDGHLDTLAE